VFLRANVLPKRNRPQEGLRTSILYLLRLPQHRSEKRRLQKTPYPHPKITRIQKSIKSRTTSLPEAPSVSVPHHPKVDWFKSAHEVARAITSLRDNKVHPGSGEHPHSPYGNCKLRPQFAWDPKTQRVGLLDHWLPYLRLGHCLITLGAFGCAIGHDSGPNGKLFDRLLKRTAKQSSTARYWPQGEPRGLCQP
jgi:hypothetical protein